MEGIYTVCFGGVACGKVQIIKQGLYYRIFCRCSVSKNQVCRLRVQFQNGFRNLGILTPVEDGFGLCTKIPVKYIQEIPVHFLLVPVNPLQDDRFAPIVPEEPFSYIEKLKEAYLVKKDGKMGIWIP